MEPNDGGAPDCAGGVPVTLPIGIAAGEQLVFTIGFYPTAAGAFDDQLSISGFTFGLHGVGTTTGKSGVVYGTSIAANSSLFRVDFVSGVPVAHTIGRTGLTTPALAIDPQTLAAYVLDQSARLYRLDLGSAKATAIGPTGIVGARPNSLVVGPTGDLFTWGALDASLYRIDTKSGRASLVGRTGYRSGGDLAFDASGRLFGSTGDSLVSIDPNTGHAEFIGAFGVQQVFGLAFDASGTLFAASDESGVFGASSQLYRVDQTSGFATPVGARLGASMSDLAFAPPRASLSLAFPLKATAPLRDDKLTPYSAPVISVFDHAMAAGALLRPYGCDTRVVAYTNETGSGEAQGGEDACSSHPGRRGRGAFTLGTGQYVGAGVDGKQFLNYDGHPGFDYRAATGTPVFASVSGTVHYPKRHFGLSSASKFHVLELVPASGAPFRIYYLHLKTHPSAPRVEAIDPTPLPGCPATVSLPLPEGASVGAGCLVALSGFAGTADAQGNVYPHLHFEVHRVVDRAPGTVSLSSPVRCVDELELDRDNVACVPVDPYGWRPPKAGVVDPYEALSGLPPAPPLWSVPHP